MKTRIRTLVIHGSLALAACGGDVSRDELASEPDAGVCLDADGGGPPDAGSSTVVSPDDSLCGLNVASPRLVSWRPSGHWDRSSGDSRYEGWAVVERSVSDWMVLAVGDDPAAEDPAHVLVWIHGFVPLPVGSRVWLLAQTNLFGHGGFGPKTPGETLVVRDREGGRVLFAAANRLGSATGLDSELLRLGNPIAICNMPSRCLTNGVFSVFSLEASADEPTRVSPGEQATITLDGAPFNLVLHGATRETGVLGPGCADVSEYGNLIWVSYSLLAADPEPLITQLAQVEPPQCRVGNDEGFSFGSAVDSPFRSFVPLGSQTAAEEWHSTATAIASDDWLAFQLGCSDTVFRVDGSAFVSAPAPGDRYWVDTDRNAFVMREGSQRGPIVAAGLNIYPHGAELDEENRASITRLSQWLGVPVTLEPSCLHEFTTHDAASESHLPEYLFKANIGDEVVESGHHIELTLEGTRYDVWLWTQLDGFDLAIRRAY